MGLIIWASVLTVKNLEFWGFGFRVQGLGFRVQGLGFRVEGSGFRDECFVLRF